MGKKKLNKLSDKYAIEFAQYVAEEHYVLVNIEKGNHIWKNEDSELTTKKILKKFKKAIKDIDMSYSYLRSDLTREEMDRIIRKHVKKCK